jgi:hypothetical protein
MSATTIARSVPRLTAIQADDLLDRDRDRVAVTVDHVADAVTDKDDIDARLIDDPSGRVIVCGQADQLFSFSFAASIAGR